MVGKGSLEYLTNSSRRILKQTLSILEQDQAHAICSRERGVGMSLGLEHLTLGH